ncbi:KN motif and ankyrin repeat domain-containing protein 4 [Erpetoichthys calabaricus]|uniref:KN motif and ankyrin repeat domains 4 n=1 Tax=Erpetoichthys calabaricus TaxID=27687 RepID=A0A8C4X8K6_ERPCA|nr:KN motif and ankyrin repeat domain-containing protein 4 [Erpetoichthys calabaricus]XP_028666755.1 KN motif and ankyrin repeat domain-containing protein 4 [Erpetoichthys calabaricus]XP_028666757.1 KN motif and ankyrin repeat domain-containing protein 4 [Erpetoichthys calabaricus]
MDSRSADGLSLKPLDGSRQRKPIPYSVETPYGFHLDLDFLKYVDDIEKGHTIKRIHIQRRAKAPKFSTLPRNFSLPNGTRSIQKDGWLPSSRGRSGTVGVRHVLDFEAAAAGPRGAREDAAQRLFDEQPLGFRVKPQLLRASSMPVTVLQRKHSESSEDIAPPPPGSVPGSYDSSEVLFRSCDGSSLPESLEPPLVIQELEQEVASVPYRSCDHSLTQPSGGNKQDLASSPKTSGKDREEEEEGKATLQASSPTSGATDNLTIITLRTKLTVLEKQLKDTTRDLEKAKDLLKQQAEGAEKEKEVGFDPMGRQGPGPGVPTQRHDVSVGTDTKELCDRGVTALDPQIEMTTRATQIQADEFPCLVYSEEKGVQVDGPPHEGPVGDRVHAFEGGQVKPRERSPPENDLGLQSTRSPGIGQRLTKIQELLHEQQGELESNYPELSLSKVSLIQRQLLSSFSALRATWQSPPEDNNANLQTPGEGSSPSSTLKSIMKKKDSRRNATKKNLKFVGVNGGYESTSSDESSSEDSIQVDTPSGAEDEGAIEGDDGAAQEVTPDRTAEDSQQPRRVVVSEDFLHACHFLKDQLKDIEFPDQKQAQCLSLVYQEWFGVSSQKRSSAGEVSHYLQELVAISAEMVEFVVNLADGNGNTALHYSVSHSNFDIITLLLDTGVCQVDCQNKAGYTAIMLVSLAVTESQKDMEVALKLLKQGDINARASQAGQTALMLAASHGRVDMARALLECCANVNVRDNKGRSALLRASEHGHLDMVRLLLAQPACDVQISDSEGRTALSVAQDGSHADVADLLAAHSREAEPQLS